MKLRAFLLSLLCLPTAIQAGDSGFTVVRDGEYLVLDNGRTMRAWIAPERGGELSGLEVLHEGNWHELLYRAKDYSEQPGWRGKAPLVWPATGISMVEAHGMDHCELNGKACEMPFHGFARHRAWEVLETVQDSDSASATLRLLPDAETLCLYPFEFDLRAQYRLYTNFLAIDYEIAAGLGNVQPLPFSVGNQITFRAPLIPGSQPSMLEFETALPDRLLTKPGMVFSGVVKPSPFTGRHNIGALPRREVVSLSGDRGAPVELAVIDPSGFGLRLLHQASEAPSLPAIRFNLWADVEDGFFSPQPWVGMQNSLNSGTGLVHLDPGESWQWRVEVILDAEKLTETIVSKSPQ